MPDVLDSSYQEAVLDAMVAEPQEIRPLVVLSQDSALSTIQGQYVLLGSIHHFPESYPDSTVMQLPVTAWTFTDKELIAWLKDPKHVLPDNQEIWRLKQMLGLPPHEYYSHISFYWVHLKDVIRPATSIDPRQEVMQPVLNQATPLLYKEWFQEQVVDAYSSHLYPWTRLGYTYDWGKSEQDDAYGVSEFLVHRGAVVSVAVTLPLIDFIKSPQLSNSKVQLAYQNMVGSATHSETNQSAKLSEVNNTAHTAFNKAQTAVNTVSNILEPTAAHNLAKCNLENTTSDSLALKNISTPVSQIMESNLQLQDIAAAQTIQTSPSRQPYREQVKASLNQSLESKESLLKGIQINTDGTNPCHKQKHTASTAAPCMQKQVASTGASWQQVNTECTVPLCSQEHVGNTKAHCPLEQTKCTTSWYQQNKQANFKPDGMECVLTNFPPQYLPWIIG